MRVLKIQAKKREREREGDRARERSLMLDNIDFESSIRMHKAYFSRKKSKRASQPSRISKREKEKIKCTRSEKMKSNASKANSQAPTVDEVHQRLGN